MNVPFKFSILNSTFQFMSIVGGVPTPGPAPIYFPGDSLAPFINGSIMDWTTLSLNYKRDAVMLGMIRGYAPSAFRFTQEAAQILRFIKNTQGGAEAIAYLGVYLPEYDNPYVFHLLDYWAFDFSNIDNQQLFFQVAIMESGMSARAKAFMSQNYSIPLNDPAQAPGLAGQLAPINTFPLYLPLPSDLIPLAYPVKWNVPIAPEVPYLIYMDGIPIMAQAQFVTDSLGETLTLLTHSEGVGAETLCTPSLVNSLTVGDYFGNMGTIQNPLLNQLVNVMPFTVATTAIFVASQFNKCRMKVAFNMNLTCQHALIGMSDIKCQLVMTITAGTAPAWGALVVPRIVLMEDTVWQAPDTTRTLTWKGETGYFDIEENYIISIGFTYDVPPGTPSGMWPDSHVLINFAPADVTNPLPVITLKGTFIPDSSVTRAITHFQLFRQLAAYVATNGGLLAPPMTTDPSTWVKSTLLTTDRDPTLPENVDLNPRNTLFSCGDAMRGLTVNTIVDPNYPPYPDPRQGLPFDQQVAPAIYTNLQDVVRDIMTDACAGVGIERNGFGTDQLVIEDLRYFFDDDDVDFLYDLGDNISNFSMTEFNDYRGSSISLGQSDQQFDSLNGPYETLSEVDWSLPSMRNIKNVDWKTAIRSDPYGAELTRTNVGNKTNTNSSSDNDTFKFQCTNLIQQTLEILEQWGALSGYEPIIAGVVQVQSLMLQRAGIVAAGLPKELLSPDVFQGMAPDAYAFSMYNLTFSPQRKALRSLPWLCSNYRGLLDNLMGITGYKKNILLQSVVCAGSPMITESNWLNLSEVPQTYIPPFSSNPVTVQPCPIPAGKTTALIFKPYKFTFMAPGIPNLPKLMTPPGTAGGGKMYKKIKFIFTRDGIKYPLAGFVLDIGMTPGTNAPYSYQLLCSPTVVIPNSL